MILSTMQRAHARAAACGQQLGPARTVQSGTSHGSIEHAKACSNQESSHITNIASHACTACVDQSPARKECGPTRKGAHLVLPHAAVLPLVPRLAHSTSTVPPCISEVLPCRQPDSVHAYRRGPAGPRPAHELQIPAHQSPAERACVQRQASPLDRSPPKRSLVKPLGI